MRTVCEVKLQIWAAGLQNSFCLYPMNFNNNGEEWKREERKKERKNERKNEREKKQTHENAMKSESPSWAAELRTSNVRSVN